MTNSNYPKGPYPMTDSRITELAAEQQRILEENLAAVAADALTIHGPYVGRVHYMLVISDGTPDGPGNVAEGWIDQS
jgi:hypothetical protein